jgi:RNA polymerase sigma-32 factor
VTSANQQLATLGTSLDQYMAEVNRFDLLSREEELELAKRYQSTQDLQSAQSLVTANLRFVVKVAYEYKNYNIKLVDLIQEGNIGLMKAVRRFNPDRGYRLISYAVWWIKAYIQNYIIKSWSMVKIGSTARHRKMLFGKRDPHAPQDDEQETFLMPTFSSMNSGELKNLSTDVARRDFSLDMQLDGNANTSYVDILESDHHDAEFEMGRQETREIVDAKLQEAVEQLNERELYILHERLLSDEPSTLQAIGNEFGVSRERARQLEANLKKKLAQTLSQEFSSESIEVIDL